jgi:hypothetical protein
MAELIWRLRTAPRAYREDLLWVLLVGGAAALVLGYAMTISLQAGCALVLVLVVIALYQQDEQWGLLALLSFWLLAPFIRRLLGLMTGPVANDPLSLAPFLATGALAALAMVRVHIPTRVRVVLLIGAGGFAMGLPIGFTAGPRSAIYAFIAYIAAVSAGVLGYAEGVKRSDSMVRKVLVVGLPLVALYAIAQRYLPLTPWDQRWLDVTDFNSIGTSGDHVRVFGTLNSPGTLGALLAMSLITYMTVAHHRFWAIAGATIVLVGLSLTFVRSAWWALVLAGVAHVIASRGESARVIGGAAAITVIAAIALSPVSSAARDVVDRFESITRLGGDRSATDRQTSFHALLPKAVTAPVGHGLGTAGESTKLGAENSALRYADNGYLSLMYQVGPVGFLLVVAAMAFILQAAWEGARARAPGQQWRLAMFAILVYVVFMLPSGDTFYGSSGIVLWFIGGQALAFRYRQASTPALE